MTPLDPPKALDSSPANQRQMSASEVRDALAGIGDYFQKVDAAFKIAVDRTGEKEHVFSLAGNRLRLRLAGPALEPILIPALAHLPPGGMGPALEVLCWDGAATGLTLPAPSWPWPAIWPPDGVIHPFGLPEVRLTHDANHGITLLYRADTRRAIFWTRDAMTLHSAHYGSPLLTLLSWWLQRCGLVLLHGGCVGLESGALLLAGKGGAGKSTTSLLCAEAGMKYVSDDYCAVRTGGPPVAYAVYSSGKLHRSHLRAFPRLASSVSDLVTDDASKPIIFLQQRFPDAVAVELPLRAIAIPMITGRPETHFETATAADALRALAPSTIFQLPHGARESLHALAALSRALPCYRLHLGTRFDEIPEVVRSLLRQATP